MSRNDIFIRIITCVMGYLFCLCFCHFSIGF